MNITDRLAETLFQPSCGRCGQPHVAGTGWQSVMRQDLGNGRIYGADRLCPACVVDYDWWFSHPPENPDTDSVSSTHVPKGTSDAVRSTIQ